MLIELKTEPLSHRPGQLAHYLDLAVHHHRASDISLLYLTPTMEFATPQPMPKRTQYAHTYWRTSVPSSPAPGVSHPPIGSDGSRECQMIGGTALA
ncbi:MAG: hypothetical protein M3O70_18590 [Actinomycetota bacterium]|nr:hypothetical protein [Actinomycetota bacterium]